MIDWRGILRIHVRSHLGTYIFTTEAIEFVKRCEGLCKHAHNSKKMADCAHPPLQHLEAIQVLFSPKAKGWGWGVAVQ